MIRPILPVTGLLLLPLLGGCAHGEEVGSAPSEHSSSGGETQASDGGPGSGGATSSGGNGAYDSGMLIFNAGGAQAAADSGAATDSGQCETTSSETEMKPAVLGFAFDVSGSMGEGDYAWHDKALKWDPVVSATKAFFADPGVTGISASVTFFPEKAEDPIKCALAAYETPDVALAALPSDGFANAIQIVEQEEWGDGTPTIYAVRGVIQTLQAEAARNPNATYAQVLVTDGYPQDCAEGGENTIPAVAAEVAKVAATIPTYVIGVANPPIEGAPDTVTDLHEIARQGGTDQAFLIDTGDPQKTAESFRAAVDTIRRTAASCTLGIPPAPEGKTFVKENVTVTYRTGDGGAPLTYDADCAGENSWHYDDPANPKQIVLCGSTCGAVQVDSTAKLSVGFTCTQQIDLR